MATTMDFLINYVNGDVAYGTTPADYIELDLTNDYLIWTAGDATVKNNMTHEPTASELNAAATVISDIADTDIALCLLMDYSHDVGGAYYTHTVVGMGINKQYVFCFNFDNATAMIPRLEAWDTSAHTTSAKNVLGAGTAVNSMVKAIKTTSAPPGALWAGTSIAGAANYIDLDTAALTIAKALYANIKIVVPTAYATPAAETFCLTIRYTYL
jgi:hypothetical protein